MSGTLGPMGVKKAGYRQGAHKEENLGREFQTLKFRV